MPLTHTRSFRVRFYECDAHGHLNNANYLRFMQETAFDASASAGYGITRYQEMQRHWWIRETGVEYLTPLRYGDVVNVTTWISDFRRATSRRLYKFRQQPDNRLVAEAYTDWAFLDTSTNLPARIPEQLAIDFFPEGVPENFPPREPFPVFPTPPEGVFKMQRQVSFSDIDGAGHVNNAVYLNYITECGMQAIAYFNWPWQRMQSINLGIFIRRMRIQYLQQALLDDELEISTWFSNVRRSTADRFYTIHRLNDQALIARVYNMGVWVDLKNGQPHRLPPELLEDFAANISK